MNTHPIFSHELLSRAPLNEFERAHQDTLRSAIALLQSEGRHLSVEEQTAYRRERHERLLKDLALEESNLDAIDSDILSRRSKIVEKMASLLPQSVLEEELKRRIPVAEEEAEVSTEESEVSAEESEVETAAAVDLSP